MDVEELLDSIDIVEYISQFVELEERGDEYWGLSPFTDEKTPSFSVRRETGKFYDFSSGAGGSVIYFIQRYFKCSYKEAINKIKEYAGCEEKSITGKRRLSATMDCRKFRSPQRRGKKSKTTVLPCDYMKRYVKDDGKLEVWRKEGISESSLDKFQVCYDSFSDRLVYPIRDVEGNIVNVGGRALDPQWKEKGMRKYTYFFSWGTMNTIYGLSDNMKEITDAREVILFEGCKSVLLADTWGIHNCGALLTSHLNDSQMKILAKLGCRVVFALDKGINIREDKNIRKLKNYVNVEYLLDDKNILPDKFSPVDSGIEVFKRLYNGRRRFR